MTDHSPHAAEAEAIAPPADRGTQPLHSARLIPHTLLKASPTQPRHVFNQAKLAELRESIRVHQVQQPLLVRRRDDEIGDGEPLYEIVDGERRWRCATAWSPASSVATQVAVYANVQLLVAMALSSVWLAEPLDLNFLVGSAVVASGIVAVNWPGAVAR